MRRSLDQVQKSHQMLKRKPFGMELGFLGAQVLKMGISVDVAKKSPNSKVEPVGLEPGFLPELWLLWVVGKSHKTRQMEPFGLEMGVLPGGMISGGFNWGQSGRWVVLFTSQKVTWRIKWNHFVVQEFSVTKSSTSWTQILEKKGTKRMDSAWMKKVHGNEIFGSSVVGRFRMGFWS